MRQVLLFFITWRLGLFLLAFLAPLIIPVFGNRFPYADDLLKPSGLPQWLWSWANFDGVHYLTIAQKGYVAEFTQAFFPLYPMLVGTIAPIIFNQFILVGVVLSSIVFFAGVYVFQKLLQLDYEPKQTSWILLFLIMFPTSFYFGAFYTEGLFFLLVIASLYMARKGNWLMAGVLGALASATRFAGIFLLPALVIEYIMQYGVFNPRGSTPEVQHQTFPSPVQLLRAVPLLLIPIGLVCYMVYLKKTFGDPFLFFRSLQDFNTGRSESIVLLPQVIWRYLKIFATVNPASLLFFNAAYEFTVTVFFAALIVLSVKRVRLSYVLFSALVYISPTLTGTLTSMPRYVLLCISAFIVLGLLQSKVLKIAILSIFAVLLLVSVLLFVQGYWIA